MGLVVRVDGLTEAQLLATVRELAEIELLDLRQMEHGEPQYV